MFQFEGDWEGEDNQLPDAIRQQAEVWFGPDVKLWNHLSTVTSAKSSAGRNSAIKTTNGHDQIILPQDFFCAVII